MRYGRLSLREIFDAAAEMVFEVIVFEDDIPEAEQELRAWAADRGIELIDSTRDIKPRAYMPEGLWVSVLRVKNARPMISVHRSQRNHVARRSTACPT